MLTTLHSRVARACVLALLAGLALAAPSVAAPDEEDRQVVLSTRRLAGYRPRIATPKPELTLARAGFSERILQVKFRQGSTVRLRGGAFATLTGDDLGGLQAVLARHPGLRLARMVRRTELVVAEERARLEDEHREEFADLNLWYKVHLPAGASAAAVANELNALAIVEIAYPEALPEPPPVSGNYAFQQDYIDPAPTGIDVAVARTLPGGFGSFVKVFDIEYDWNTQHEDISRARLAGATIPNGTKEAPFANDHGTAVIGMLVADQNNFGVTGIVPSAQLRMINQRTTTGDARVAAIDLAHANAARGDVVVLEMQSTGPNGECSAQDSSGCMPVEWTPAVYDAIKLLVADRIFVVEAAGNGGQDLDDPQFNSWTSKGPSGAFLVGAGGSDCGLVDLRSRHSFSNYGSMVFLQGWGDCVTTTGYGDLEGSAESNNAYTNTFSGTSSATPIVAGAVALYSSIYQAANGADTAILPVVMQALLSAAGSQQPDPEDGQIGALPNLRAVLAKFDTVAPARPALSLADASNGSTTLTDGGVTATAVAQDNFGVAGYFISGSPATPAANAPGWSPSGIRALVASGVEGTKTFYAWAKDAKGNVSPRASATITLDNTRPAVAFTVPPVSRTTAVPVTISGTDAHGIDAYYLSENPAVPIPAGPGWVSQAPATFTVSQPAGMKTIYAWTRDGAGNMSLTASDSVLVDAERPVVTIATPVKGAKLKRLPRLEGTATDNLSPPYRRADFALGKRRGGGNCDWWNPNKKVFVAGKCSAPQWYRIRQGNNLPGWKRPVGLRVPGSYFVMARYIDRVGNATRATARFSIVR